MNDELRKVIIHRSEFIVSYNADREGFEPPVRLHAQQFSRLPPSTARPPVLLFGTQHDEIQKSEILLYSDFKLLTCCSAPVEFYNSKRHLSRRNFLISVGLFLWLFL